MGAAECQTRPDSRTSFQTTKLTSKATSKPKMARRLPNPFSYFDTQKNRDIAAGGSSGRLGAPNRAAPRRLPAIAAWRARPARVATLGAMVRRLRVAASAELGAMWVWLRRGGGAPRFRKCWALGGRHAAAIAACVRHGRRRSSIQGRCSRVLCVIASKAHNVAASVDQFDVASKFVFAGMEDDAPRARACHSGCWPIRALHHATSSGAATVRLACHSLKASIAAAGVA